MAAAAGEEARPRGKGPAAGTLGVAAPHPGKAPQTHSPAARRPPRPGDGPGARGGPSAIGTIAPASTPAASASGCLRRPPSARTRPLLRSPRGLGSRRRRMWGRPRIPPPPPCARAAPGASYPHAPGSGSAAGTAQARGLGPASGRLKLPRRGGLELAVRTRGRPEPSLRHLEIWTPTASLRETLLDAPPLSLTHFPDLARMRQ